MPELSRKSNERYYSEYHHSSYPTYIHSNTKNSLSNSTDRKTIYRPKRIRKQKSKKYNLIRSIIALSILGVFFGIIMPFSYNNITKVLFNPNPYKEIQTDLHEIAFPTSKYLSNSWAFDQKVFAFSAPIKDAKMLPLKENVNMPVLEQELKKLGESYKSIKPSIFVWDYDTQNYVDIDASQNYATASIIKIPVLIQVFKQIESGTLSLDDKMPLTEYYRSEGSGSMQFKAANSEYTIDELARRMITESDNSATNMLIAKVGSMNDINRALRNWGMKDTQLHTWLPDMRGTNRTTAREMATMLYNIDENDKFLSESSREKMFNYMGNVHNNRLINAGLGAGAVFLHKTGDIGSMLGDAGIVITPKGKKYIVVILANRPHNSVAGKDYIVQASKLIYNYMVK